MGRARDNEKQLCHERTEGCISIIGTAGEKHPGITVTLFPIRGHLTFDLSKAWGLLSRSNQSEIIAASFFFDKNLWPIRIRELR